MERPQICLGFLPHCYMLGCVTWRALLEQRMTSLSVPSRNCTVEGSSWSAKMQSAKMCRTLSLQRKGRAALNWQLLARRQGTQAPTAHGPRFLWWRLLSPLVAVILFDDQLPSSGSKC